MSGFVIRPSEGGTSFRFEAKLESVPERTLNSGEARVRILCSALNHRDNWITQGMYPGIKPGVVLGSDCVGVVESCPSSKSWEGHRVLLDPSIGWDVSRPDAPEGSLSILGMPVNGTFADTCIVPIRNLRMAPEFLADAQAAALPLAGVTAYRAVVTKGLCKRDDYVLVTGCGGGVAIFAIQIAVALGAKVFVTSSSQAKIDRAVKDLGVLGGVNYHEENWSASLLKMTNKRKFDVVVDGGGEVTKLLRVCAGGARLVSYGATAAPQATLTMPSLFLNNVDLKGTAMGSPKDFDGLLEIVRLNKIVPIVDEVFPFHDFPSALAKMRKGDQFGKLVLDHSKSRSKM